MPKLNLLFSKPLDPQQKLTTQMGSTLEDYRRNISPLWSNVTEPGVQEELDTLKNEMEQDLVKVQQAALHFAAERQEFQRKQQGQSELADADEAPKYSIRQTEEELSSLQKDFYALKATLATRDLNVKTLEQKQRNQKGREDQLHLQIKTLNVVIDDLKQQNQELKENKVMSIRGNVDNIKGNSIDYKQQMLAQSQSQQSQHLQQKENENNKDWSGQFRKLEYKLKIAEDRIVQLNGEILQAKQTNSNGNVSIQMLEQIKKNFQVAQIISNEKMEEQARLLEIKQKEIQNISDDKKKGEAQLQKRILSLQAEIDLVQAEKRGLNAKEDAANDAMERLACRVEELMLESQTAISERDEWKEEATRGRNRCEDLKAQLTVVQLRMYELSQEYEEEKVVVRGREKEEIREIFDQKERELNDALKKIDQLELREKESRIRLEDKLIVIQKLQDELQATEREERDKVFEYQESVKNLEMNIESYKLRAAQKDEQIEQIKRDSIGENDKLVNSNQVLTEQLNLKVELIESLENQVVLLNEQVESAEGKVNQVMEMVEENERVREEQLSTIEQLKKQLDDIQSGESSNQKNEELIKVERGKVQELEEQIAGLKQQFEEQVNENNELRIVMQRNGEELQGAMEVLMLSHEKALVAMQGQFEVERIAYENENMSQLEKQKEVEAIMAEREKSLKSEIVELRAIVEESSQLKLIDSSELTEKLTQQIGVNDQLVSERKRMEGVISGFEARLSVVTGEKQSMLSTIDDLERSIEKLAKQNELLSSEITRRNEEYRLQIISGMEAQVQAEQKACESCKAIDEKSLQTIVEGNLEESMERLREEKTAVEVQYEMCNAKNSELIERVHQMSLQNQELIFQNEEIADNLEKTTFQLQEITRMFEQQEEDIIALQESASMQEKRALENAIHTLMVENTELKESLYRNLEVLELKNDQVSRIPGLSSPEGYLIKSSNQLVVDDTNSIRGLMASGETHEYEKILNHNAELIQLNQLLSQRLEESKRQQSLGDFGGLETRNMAFVVDGAESRMAMISPKYSMIMRNEPVYQINTTTGENGESAMNLSSQCELNFSLPPATPSPSGSAISYGGYTRATRIYERKSQVPITKNSLSLLEAIPSQKSPYN